MTRDSDTPRDFELSATLSADASPSACELDRLEPGTSLGDFEVIDKLGVGGMGVVYKARHQVLERIVALKLLKTDPDGQDTEHIIRFLREARNAAALEHPNIVTVYSTGRFDDAYYIEMQYVAGESLRQIVDRGPIPARDAVRYIDGVAAALEHAHRHGVIHRDIKPSNILVRDDGQIKVVDFGLSRSQRKDPAVTQAGQCVGTLYYMPPEQWSSAEHDARSDLYALGITFFHLLVGRPPFQGSLFEIASQHATEEVPLAHTLNPRVPEALSLVIRRLTAKVPEDRYQSAEALRVALRPHRAPSGANEPRASVPEKVTLEANPYRGLGPFEPEHARWYFGRQNLVSQLVRRFERLSDPVAREAGEPRLLPVLGPSGCGKSSLVRAGLVATLEGVWRHDAETLLTVDDNRRKVRRGLYNAAFVIFTPTARPIDELALHLARLTGEELPVAKAAELSEVLRKPGPGGTWPGISRVVRAISRLENRQVILVVDQFEEVYSLCDRDDERDAFIGALLTAACDPGGRVSAILTLRADFLGQTQHHQTLNRILATHGVLVPVMTETELREAISEPAARAGCPLDQGTVELLVSQARDRHGVLPLLQFALARIWEGLAEGVSPPETLRSIGGVGGALAGEAQRIYQDFSTQQQRIARRSFLAMVRLGEGARDTRRRVRVETLVARGEDPQSVRQVLRAFSQPGARLITLSSTPDGHEQAEVAHEALFQYWAQLHAWVEEGREDVRFNRVLEEAAGEWDSSGCPDGLLWAPPRLEQLRAYSERAAGDMTARQLEFLEASEAFETRKQRERRRVLLLKRAIWVGLAAVLVVVSAQALNSFRLYRRAQAARLEYCRYLITSSTVEVGRKDPVLGLLLALNALHHAKSARVESNREAVEARREAMAMTGGWYFPRQAAPVSRILFSAGSERLFADGPGGTAWWTIRDPGTRHAISSDNDGLQLVGASTHGALLLSRAAPFGLQSWHVDGGLADLFGFGEASSTPRAAVSPDGRLLYLSQAGASSGLWSLEASPKKLSNDIALLEGQRALALTGTDSEAHAMLATHTPGAGLSLWRLAATGSPALIPGVVFGASDEVSATFDAKGRWLLTGSPEGGARLWRLDRPGRPGMSRVLSDARAAVSRVALSPSGRWAAVGLKTGAVYLEQLEGDVSDGRWDGGTTFRAREKENAVIAMAFSPDDRFLAVSWSNGGLWMWNLSYGASIDDPCSIVARDLDIFENGGPCTGAIDGGKPAHGLARIDLKISPAGSETIWLDGMQLEPGPVGPAGQTLDLADGTPSRHLDLAGNVAHHIRISRPGCARLETVAWAPPGGRRVVGVTLECDGTGELERGSLDWVEIPGGAINIPLGAAPPEARKVTVSPFRIMRAEVTVADYQRCVDAGKCEPISRSQGETAGCNFTHGGARADHPMNCANWHQARGFCEFIDGRLPSESEWVYAATARGERDVYPWGTEEATCARAIMDSPEGPGCGQNRTWAVCSVGAGVGPNGLCDTAGNVWEWVEDCFHRSRHLGEGPTDGGAWTRECDRPDRVLLGGSFKAPAPLVAQGPRNRMDPNFFSTTVGFRCVSRLD